MRRIKQPYSRFFIFCQKRLCSYDIPFLCVWAGKYIRFSIASNGMSQTMNNEKLRHIISIIGEERVESVYQFIGGEKMSFAALYRQLLFDKISVRISEGQSFRQIAKDLYISRMTVYRTFRRMRRRK